MRSPILPLSRGSLRLFLAACFATFIAGVSATPTVSRPVANETVVEKALETDLSATSNIYIIGFVEPPLGRYNGENARFTAPPRLPGGRLDVRAPQAVAYVAHLEALQTDRLVEASKLLGRDIDAEMSFKHAYNGVVLRLTESEAARIGTLPGVERVEPYAEYPLDTDNGPLLIGAPSIWSGSSTPTGASTRGEGMVLGIIDSGINLDSPSFAATEPGNATFPGGYVHQNPLGSGNFLGSCAAGGADFGQCNDKLIGAYDFVFTVVCTAAPPAAPCPAGFNDEASVEDNNGHGTHTASTAGGNATTVTFTGFPLAIQGVARHANVIAYDVCYTNAAGQGLCPTVSTLSAVDRSIADGLVSVLNFSISGGEQPWLDSVSQAFLAANNAGIYVAASAGNSGPGPATLGHVEPWVANTAASTHQRVFAFDFDLTGPGTPPANTQNIVARPGGAPISNVSQVNVPLIVSPNFGDPPNDGCTPYPADFFRRPATPTGTQGMAVLRLAAVGSNCASGARRTAALAAGASSTLFIVDGPTNLGANNTTWQIDFADWVNISAHVATDPSDARATITAPLSVQLTQQADVLAGFSSRGPSGFDILKPDIMAPGLNILAAYAGNSLANNVISGTSMASPHHAGSAALIRALQPTWTPSEVKSALMTTASTTAIFKENRLTPADPHDRGAGRVDLTRAAKAGLVFDETAFNFTAANPATGGDPATLNLPSFQNDNCVATCSFTRRVRNPRPVATTYNLALSGLPAGSFNISPPSFTIAPGATLPFTLAVDGLQLTQNVWAFAELTLTPTNTAIPTARLPVAIRAAQPDVRVAPASLSVSLAPASTTTRPLQVFNDGNPTLIWSADTVGLGLVPLLRQTNNGANGFSTNFYAGHTPPGGVYTSDDFTPAGPTTLRRINVEGFMTGTGTQALNALATQITFKIYNDGAGVPAGNPEAGAGGEVYSCTRTPGPPNNAGLTFQSADGAFFELNLANATGCPAAPALSAGTRYWVAVFPRVPGNNLARRWVWFRATAEAGNPAVLISPQGVTTPPTPPPPTTWTAVAPVAAFATSLEGQVQCGAPWFNLTPAGASLGVGASTNVTVNIDSTSLAPGNHTGFACIDTNGTDPDEPKVVVPINLTVSGTPTNPTATTRANPLTLGVGQSSLLTVTVTPGELPTSTGITVTGNLTTIGGSATQTFFDDGTNGDVTGGDNTFSFNATVAVGTTTGAKSLPVTINDAQARTAAASISMTVAATTNPNVFGRSTPASVTAGTNILLTTTVTPGAFPTSTGLTSTVNLTAIGGAAAQAFRDDGLQGDVTANDRVFSFRTNVAPGTTAGAKTLAITITDAQGRTNAPTNISMTVFAGTPLAASGNASPANVLAGASSLLTVTVTPGAAPTSTGIAVRVDLTSIGGSASQLFFDDGTNGDVTAGNNVFTRSTTVAAGTSLGAKTLPASITDNEGRTGSTNISLTVVASTPPSGMGASAPASVAITQTSLLTVTVTPGANPTSTGIDVLADLTSIGGSGAQAFVDDGTQGDAAAGDNIWSYTATVAASTAPGAKTFPVTITDDQSRTASASIGLDVQTPGALGATGASSPSSVGALATSLLTVTVTPGTTPPSSGIEVRADLSSIGGAANQQFVDDGATQGDVTAGDNIWSYAATVPYPTAAGAKSFPVSVTDREARAASTTIGLTVLAATNPTGTGNATPSSVLAGGNTLLTVTTTAGTNPPSTALTVTANLAAIGGGTTQAFFDDGTNGDVTGADGIFSFNATVSAGTTAGVKNLPATIADDEGRTGTASIALNVPAAGSPSGTGLAVPSQVQVGGQATLLVTVSPGTNPPSSGITVRADLSGINGSATQVFRDDGLSGDQTAGDNVFTYVASIPMNATPGQKTMAVTINDAQIRTATSSISLQVIGGDAMFGDGFENP